jgi:hypothetical protein
VSGSNSFTCGTSTCVNTKSNGNSDFLFVSGEGPRSRRYGRTAALRLLVQPCDEDDDDDDDYYYYYYYYFLSFS